MALISIDNLEGYLREDNTWFMRSTTGEQTTNVLISFGENYETHQFKFLTSDLLVKDFTSKDAKTLFQNEDAEVL